MVIRGEIHLRIGNFAKNVVILLVISKNRVKGVFAGGRPVCNCGGRRRKITKANKAHQSSQQVAAEPSPAEAPAEPVVSQESGDGGQEQAEQPVG